MRLQLHYNRDDEEIQHSLDFIRNRSYVARTMIPEGYERYFQEQARYLSAHTSTAIEGNPIGQTKAMIVLIEGADPEKPSEVEKVNLEEAYEAIAWLAQDKTTQIDQGILRTLNSTALKGLPAVSARRRGMYRPGPSLIVDADTRKVRYAPPPAEDLLELMGSLVKDIAKWRETEEGPIAAALAHFGIISVHPFEDGNGRTARLAADMMLDLTSWSVGGALSANMIILQQRFDYYESLRAVQGEDFKEKVDVTDFVKFHTRALQLAAINLEEKVVWFNRRRDLISAESDGALNPRQVTAVMFMQDLGPLSSSVYAKVTSSSPSSALIDLADMMDKNLVVKVGSGPSTRYKLAEHVWALLTEEEEEEVEYEAETQPNSANGEPDLERAEKP